jgi:pimeloyl-ACP methyl ester carboxylesterase
MKRFRLLFLILPLIAGHSFAQKQVVFYAQDTLEVTADWYEAGEDLPLIILCHQAGWSRGEYQETALWLNSLHFNCLALDQRSGEGVNNVPNVTAAQAKKLGKGQTFLDAEPDILAAIQWGIEKRSAGVILVGSSYSASLVLKIAHQIDMVIGVAAFSPGEYFGAKLNLGKAIDGLEKPTFITASKVEMGKMKPLEAHVQPGMLTTYVPQVEGQHGSRALWTSKTGYEGYRRAFSDWLLRFQE